MSTNQKIHPFFHFSSAPSSGVIELLQSVTLGTNGAMYQHLDTRMRIMEADNPLFLMLQRKDKLLGNITFCRRADTWYIRYFAFSGEVQASGSTKSVGTGVLKNSLQKFFDDLMMNGYESEKVSNCFAYVDPKNKKSLWMSENFKFRHCATLATQTFSRYRPHHLPGLERLEELSNELIQFVRSNFSDYRFFTEAHLHKGPFYILRGNDQEILAFAKIDRANWKLVRLPGKFGGVYVRLIPYLPIIRNLIRPKCHTFLVPEAVYVKNSDPKVLERFFSGILHNEGCKVLNWWVDQEELTYKTIRKKVSWGLIDRLVGVNEVYVMRRGDDQGVGNPVYPCAFDFI